MRSQTRTHSKLSEISCIIQIEKNSSPSKKFFECVKKPNNASWQAHLGGGLTGLFLGLAIMFNLRPQPWESKMRLVGLILYVILVGSLIVCWLLLPDMKRIRNQPLTCYPFFTKCKQLFPDFTCQV